MDVENSQGEVAVAWIYSALLVFQFVASAPKAPPHTHLFQNQFGLTPVMGRLLAKTMAAAGSRKSGHDMEMAWAAHGHGAVSC